jgi:glycosyltransferase involved in cell wall biosynthesis
MSENNLRFPGGATVLMAVYAGDEPNLLKRAIDSIYSGPLHPDAFVLVVDGPVSEQIDRTLEACADHYGIRILRQEHNLGLACALNAGLERVETEWVLRADADDICLPARFLAQARMLAANPDLGLLGGSILEVDTDGTALGFRPVPLTHDEIKRYATRRNPMNHVTVAFRRKLVQAVGGYPLIYRREDYGLWAALIKHGARLGNMAEVLVHVTSGRDMYHRRGGWRYAKGEVALQRHLVRCRIKNMPGAILHGLMRSSIFLLPASIRGWFYQRFLRSGFSDSRSALPNPIQCAPANRTGGNR